MVGMGYQRSCEETIHAVEADGLYDMSLDRAEYERALETARRLSSPIE
jgi:hypothetical protein